MNLPTLGPAESSTARRVDTAHLRAQDHDHIHCNEFPYLTPRAPHELLCNFAWHCTTTLQEFSSATKSVVSSHMIMHFHHQPEGFRSPREKESESAYMHEPSDTAPSEHSGSLSGRAHLARITIRRTQCGLRGLVNPATT